MGDGPGQTSSTGAPEKAPTGVRGLDEILLGGFPRDEMHLVQGDAGTGKTTLGLQFLLAGVAAGECGLYITLSQTEASLASIARSHGWSMAGLVVHELLPSLIADQVAVEQTVLHTADVELGELARDLRDLVNRVKPKRAVIDSIGIIGLLAGSSTRYHREVVALRQFMTASGCTTVFIGDWPSEASHPSRPDTEFHGIASSVMTLEQQASPYGGVRRRLRVMKMRAVPFATGYHNFAIQHGGIEVFPRLRAADAEYTEFKVLSSGIRNLDGILGGGLEKGTAALFVGPPGAGKSTMAAVFVRAAAVNGEKATVFLFDERPETVVARARGVGVPLDEHLASGAVKLLKIDGSRITEGEFSQRIRETIDDGATVIVIDSLTGYFNAMANASMLPLHMHEILDYASRRGVLTMLLVAQGGFMTVGTPTNVDVSYLSDTILVFRAFEGRGEVRRCVAAVKKRQSEHESSIRELFIGHGGVTLSDEPLRDAHGILMGQDVRLTEEVA